MEELGDWIPEFSEVKSVQGDDVLTSSDSMSEDSGDEEMPENHSEKKDDNGDDVSDDAIPVNMERFDCDIDGIDDIQSRPIMRGI
ncbi:hypothetical protein Hanom_Chr12g01139421 [Helianthus anomalus]